MVEIDSPENPYASPLDVGPSSSSARTRTWSLRVTLASTFLGALVTGVAVYLIYVNDPRTGTANGPSLVFVVVGGSLISALVWALSGWLQRSVSDLTVTFTVAALVAAVWVGVFGVYADVLSAAAVVGWPVGGLVVSVLRFSRRRWLKRRPVE